MDKRCFAFFDVDHTILCGSTGKHLAGLSMRRGIIPFWWFLKLPVFYFRYRTGYLDPSMFSLLLKKFQGIPFSQIKKMAEEIFQTKIKPQIYLEAMRLIQLERDRGRIVVLATSAPESVVLPLARYLEVPEVVATKLEVRDEVLTGNFDGDPAFGPGKQARVLKFVEKHKAELSCCSFYSDSHYDLPLLECVEEPVAVNPDGRLSRMADNRSLFSHL